MDNHSEPINSCLLKILNKARRPLSVRELRFQLKFLGKRSFNYEVRNGLRKLFRDGQVCYQRGRWFISEKKLKEDISNKNSNIPPIYPEIKHILGMEGEEKSDSASQKTHETEERLSNITLGPWDEFRKLLRYYQQCILNEEGAEASAYYNEYLKKFIFLRGIGNWYPRPNRPWRFTLPLGSHLSEFIKRISAVTKDQVVILGYPLQAVYIEKQGHPDVGFFAPVFFYRVQSNITKGALIIECEGLEPDINLKWLEYAFSRRPQLQKSFLSACGFLTSWEYDESRKIINETYLELPNLVATLSSYLSEKICEPLNVELVPNEPIPVPFTSGIYNRAVLFLGNRTRYTKSLLKELEFIEKASDEDLNKTALKYIFSKQNNDEAGEKEEYWQELEADVVDTVPLNPDQRHAVASLLFSKVSVITGPPGTGKSQVITAAMGNMRLKERSVLFASRNHKAIDTIYKRFVDNKGRPLMIRTNSKDDPALNYTFKDAINELLINSYDIALSLQFNQLKEELSTLIEKKKHLVQYAQKIAQLTSSLGEKEEKLAQLVRVLPPELFSFIEKKPKEFPLDTVKKLITKLYSLESRQKKLFRSILTFFWYYFNKNKLANIPGFPNIKNVLNELIPYIPMMENSLEAASLRLDSLDMEEKLKGLPAFDDVKERLARVSSQLTKLAKQILELDLDNKKGLPQDVDREKLATLQLSLHSLNSGMESKQVEEKTFSLLKNYIPLILKHFPCWTVTNLSVNSRIPLMPAIFDLLIIDEASQCDIPSAIPLLFRAKRVGVVGDPNQLTFCSKLSLSKDVMLRRKSGLTKMENVRFAYTQNSLFDLISRTNGVKSVFLRETYRSIYEISAYSNYTFYNGQLQVATNEKGLVVPEGMKPGIHWVEVQGEIKTSGRGCYCLEEIDKIVELVKHILTTCSFQGTLGIVTPFRQQGNRLLDAIFSGDIDYSLLSRAKVHVDTAHGFQGDERDVIIFSLCAGPETPSGSLRFLKETGNLFNVAVSRARALLVVVGNRKWAQNCGIKHIQNLAITPTVLKPEPKPSPWYPHQSPWEKILYNALVKKGLNPIPQFPVLNRRLDLALIKKSNGKDLKIDIEVDGDCHRNPDGTRKIDDFWRDITLQAMGWKVLRFWTYQLRENLDECVNKIIKEYNHEI